MYLCLMYVCPDVSNSGGGDVPTSDVSKSAPSMQPPLDERTRAMQSFSD